MLISKANRNEVYKYLFKGNIYISLSSFINFGPKMDQNSNKPFIITLSLSLMMCADFCSRSLLISFCDV